MVVVEKKHDQKTKWHGNEYPLGRQIPKANQPRSGLGGIKGTRDGKLGDVGTPQGPWDMGEADPEYGANLSPGVRFQYRKRGSGRKDVLTGYA